MIDFFYITGSQTDLVSVRRITLSSSSYQFFLRKFSLHGIFHRYGGICCSGDTHSLVYIGTSGQRITDSASKAGSRTTERLDLCRMVVGLIFKVDQPLFFFSVYIYGNYNRAGINLFRFFLILKLALCF